MTDTGQHDFDFLHGKWRVSHRRLKQRLTGNDDWQEFEGECRCQPVLGGMGNFDDNIVRLPDGPYRAVTIRSFNAATGSWSIWWLDGRYPGQLDVPVSGRFDGPIGTFLARDVFGGRPILVRFEWHKADEPLWQQSFSPDDGKSWEINWTMRFTRDEGISL